MVKQNFLFVRRRITSTKTFLFNYLSLQGIKNKDELFEKKLKEMQKLVIELDELYKECNNKSYKFNELKEFHKQFNFKAVAKYIRMSPHKIRRVLDQIRGRSYQEALMILEFLPYDAGGPIWQVVHSAAANAKHNHGLDKKKLIIHEAFANEGPKLKRFRPRAKGQAYKILKPTCHITVIMTHVEIVEIEKKIENKYIECFEIYKYLVRHIWDDVEIENV